MFLLYYPVRGFLYEMEQKKTISVYRQEMEKQREEQREALSAEEAHGNSVSGDAVRLYPKLYEDVLSYNLSNYVNGQAGLRDAWSYEQPPFDLREYGMESEVFGILTIPAMHVELPVYLGASRENLARGAAILGQTSIPVGQENGNCVIAAHRGYSGKPMFREIEALSVGDRLRLENPWGTQTWEVREISVISPEDVDAIRIREGETLLTLITCHPYGQNHHRYVVFCAPVETAGENDPKGQESPNSDTGLREQAKEEGRNAGGQVPVEGEAWGHTQRSLEKLLLTAGIPLIILAMVLLFQKKRR